MKYIVINKYIKDNDFNIKLIELLCADTSNISIDVVYAGIDTIKEYNKKDKDTWVGFDLDKDNYLIVDKNTPSLTLNDSTLQKLSANKYSINTVSGNIYYLFSKLVEENGFFIPDYFFEKYPSGENVESYFTTFMPRFSQSSMTVSIPYYMEDLEEFRTKKIVYVEDGNLKRDDFCFAVPKQREEFYKSLKCETLFLAENYVIMKTTDEVTVYAYTNSINILYGPLLNLLNSLSKSWTESIKDCKYLLDVFASKPDRKGEKPQKTRKIDYSVYNKSYIELSSNYPKITKSQRDKYFAYIAKDISQMAKEGCSLVDILDFMKSKEPNLVGLHHFNRMFKLIFNYRKGRCSLEDALIEQKLEYELHKFEVDNLMYAIRAGAFRDSNIPRAQVLTGGGTAFTTIMRVIKE